MFQKQESVGTVSCVLHMYTKANLPFDKKIHKKTETGNYNIFKLVSF